jgi:hypothetical protein
MPTNISAGRKAKFRAIRADQGWPFGASVGFRLNVDPSPGPSLGATSKKRKEPATHEVKKEMMTILIVRLCHFIVARHKTHHRVGGMKARLYSRTLSRRITFLRVEAV